MELDVLYRIPKDLAWQHVNKYVHRSSVDLAIYRPCPDRFTSKKTIRNAAGRIAPGGIFCLQCEPEISSWIIDLIEDMGMKYTIVYEYCVEGYLGQHIRPWVLAYEGGMFQSDYKHDVIKITSAKKAGTVLLPYSDFGDTVLCIGNESLPHALASKEQGRHVIVFADDQMGGLQLHFQGVQSRDMSEKKDDLVEEKQTKEEQEADMEVVHASKTEVVAKPKDVPEKADKAIASKLTDEQKRKWVEDNVIGEFED